MEWLLENAIIFQPEDAPTDSGLIANEEFVRSLKEKQDIDHDLEMIFKAWGRESPLFGELFIYADYLTTRYAAIQLRELNQVDAYVVVNAEPQALQLSPLTRKAAKADIVQVTLSAIPTPDESVSWEQIIEYRDDPDSQSKFLALRHWMSEIARAQLTPAEVEEKLEYLLDQYRQHMQLHRIKTNAGTLETIVVIGAETLGDLLSFQWGKAAQALFSLKHRQIALLEGELTSPGSEVAYIAKTRETFNP